MLKEEIKNLALLLAFVTSVLYSCGLLFYQGFLQGWGLEETLFPLSFERTVFQGFIAIGPWAVIYFFAFSASIYLICLAARALLKFLRTKKWFKTLLAKEPRNAKQEAEEPFASELQRTERLVVFSYWSLIALVLWVGSAFASNWVGMKSAQSQIERFSSGKISPTIIQHKEYGPILGHFIVCSSSHCAFLIGIETKVFRLEEISSFISKPIKATQ